jgi:hypothetical protein
MADAADSKSATRKGVKVRLLSPAPISPRSFVCSKKTPAEKKTRFRVYLNRFNMASLHIPARNNEDPCSADLRPLLS